MNKSSLRESKKEATAHALAEAAFQLALERGMDGFVVEDVVQRSGYSRRTFANYFSCKEEAVATATVPYHDVGEFYELLNRMSDSTSPIDALYQFVKMQLAEETIRRLRQLFTLSESYPNLKPYTLTAVQRLQRETQELMAELFRETHPRDYNYLLVGSVFSMIVPMFDGTFRVLLLGESADDASGTQSFDNYFETIFGYLRNGF
ncbi:TetR/AcrR family transcriptional regulator [Cohnella faecalis]|uniref:TetR family transcriptional regulator n=1 Tax=Cohnella faecalis TaxID=2315694 RepID=A0A398CG56_9BACL|nr:TetR/AcrR family transcriptional regulator [Cohnella faecalis]RIE00932.1 TetR family transcriptional regulator [Cohnella faecalis]